MRFAREAAGGADVSEERRPAEAKRGEAAGGGRPVYPYRTEAAARGEVVGVGGGSFGAPKSSGGGGRRGLIRFHTHHAEAAVRVKAVAWPSRCTVEKNQWRMSHHELLRRLH